MTDNRSRVFASVVYPESAPLDWLDTLSCTCIPCFVSPLHDKDVNADGTPKKPHYHVQLMFEGKKSIEQAKEVFDLIGGVGCERVNSTRGYARYLCHLDNPEKAQYSVSEVRAFGGSEYMSTIGQASDKYKAISEMIDFCQDNDIYSFSVLLEYARKERFDWFRILCDSASVVIEKYLKSRAWTNGIARD